jgi:23S rRNA pseudouridine2604 synthase
MSSQSIEKLMRLNKYLSEVGVCSRRAADKLIESGRVVVNNETATLGIKVNVIATSKEENNISPKTHLTSSDVVLVDGKQIGEKLKQFIYLALNKPVGIVCTTDTKREKNNIIDFVNYPSKERLFHIGRLDKPS